MNTTELVDGSQSAFSSLGARAFVRLNAFSDLACRVATVFGLGEAGAKQVRSSQTAIQASVDALGAQGFPESILDRVAFVITAKSLPGQLAQCAAGRFKLSRRELIKGVEIDAQGKRPVHWDLSREKGMAFHRALLGASAAISPDAKGARWEHALVSVRLGGLARSFKGLLMDPFSIERLVVGHELGHVLFKMSGMAEGLHDFGQSQGALLWGEGPSRSAAVCAVAEELYADAMGCLALDSSSLAASLGAVDAWRAGSELAAPQYLRRLVSREALSTWVASRAWDASLAAPELVARCFWTAADALAWESGSPTFGGSKRPLLEARLLEALRARSGAELPPLTVEREASGPDVGFATSISRPPRG